MVIEDLNVEGMMKNHRLARSIASCSWSEFFRILSYKSDWKGVNLIRIGRFEPSSKMCECGYVHRDLKLSDRIWTCPSCGAVNDWVRKTESSNPIRYVTGGEPGRGRGVAGVGRDLEASNYTGVNLYIIT